MCNMKRTKVIMSMILVLSLMFVFFGHEKTEAVTADLLMGTGGVAGVWYPLGGAICAAMSDGKAITVTVQATGGSVENIRTVASGERDFGMTSNSFAAHAYEGIATFEGEAMKNIRGVISFSPSIVQFLVREESDIFELKDFKGKRFGVGAIGSGDEANARMFLKAVGLSYDDVDEMMLSVAEQVTAFKDRKIDIIFMTASLPTSGAMDAAASEKVRFIAIKGQEKEAVLELNPYFAPATITSEHYSFVKEDVETLSSPALLVTNADLDEEVVYQALKNMFAKVETLKQAHSSMKEFSVERALVGMTVPLHPGAERFFKEAGVL